MEPKRHFEVLWRTAYRQHTGLATRDRENRPLLKGPGVWLRMDKDAVRGFRVTRQKSYHKPPLHGESGGEPGVPTEASTEESGEEPEIPAEEEVHLSWQWTGHAAIKAWREDTARQKLSDAS